MHNLIFRIQKNIKKRTLLILTATLIISGFFISNALALTGITVISPNGGEYWSGMQDITWTVADCEQGDTVNIFWGHGGILGAPTTQGLIAGGVACDAFPHSWDTNSVEDGDSFVIRIENSAIPSVFDYSDNFFTIDNTLPDIETNTLTSPNGNEYWAGGSSQDITWDSSNISDTNLGNTPISLYYTTDNGSTWNTIAEGLSNTSPYSWVVPNDIDSAMVKVKITAADKAGNTASDESDANFTIDSTDPTVGLITPNPAQITDAVVGSGTFTFIIDYNEAMSQSSVSTISFNPDVSSTLTLSSGSWIDVDTYAATYDVVDDGVEVADVDISVTGATDLAGNIQETGSSADVFDIDTKNPIITSATTTPDPAKDGTVTVTITFSEDMGTNTSPTVQIIGIIGSPISVTETSYVDHTWAGTFTLADNDEEVIATISVTGGVDLVGNAMIDNPTAGTFGVDTVDPTGYSVTIDQGQINSGNDTALSFTFADAEVDATYTYSIDDTNLGTAAVTGSGIIITPIDNIPNINVSSLDDGTLILTVYLTDPAGNQGEYVTNAVNKDSTAPTLTSVSIASDNSNASLAKVGDIITLTFTADENIQIPTVTIANQSATIGGSDASWVATYTMQSGDSEGTIAFTINFADIAGNNGAQVANTTDSSNVIFDKTPPTVEITSSETILTNVNPISITIIFSEEITGFEIGDIIVGNGTTSDLQTSNSIIFTANITPTLDGQVTIDVAVGVATDLVGNDNTSAVQFSIEYDGTPPTFTSVAVSDSDEFYKASDTISFNVNLGEIGLTVTADLIVLDSTLSSTFALADDGDNTYSGTTAQLSADTMVEGADIAVTFTAADIAGNSQTDDSLTLTIDKAPPTTSDDYVSKDDIWQNTDQTITLTPADTISGVATTKYCTDTENNCDPANDYTQAITINTEGITYFRYASTDNAGNVQETVSRIVKIDKTAPATTDNVPLGWQTSDVTVTLTCDDTTGGNSGCFKVYYTINGDNPTTSSDYVDSDSSWQFTVSTDGEYTVKYRGEDNVGNLEGVKTAANLQLDKTDPETTDDAPVGWQNADVTVTLAPTDATSGVADTLYCVDQADACVPSISGTSLTVSTDSINYVRYYSKDVAGNDEDVNSTTVLLDKTVPSTTDDTPADWQTSPFAITLTPLDDGLSPITTYYTTDGSEPNTSSAQGTTINISSDGEYTIKYLTVDDAGNSEAIQTAANTAKLDTTPPVTTDDAPAGWQNADVTVTLTCDDTTGGNSGCFKVYYTINGDNPTTSSDYVDSDSSWQFTVSTDGEYTVKYRGEDVANNLETVKTANNLLQLDKTAPAITNLTPSHTSVTSDATPTISADFTEIGSGVDVSSVVIMVDEVDQTDYATVTTNNVTYTPVISLTAGTYVVTVDVDDMAGNSAIQASWSFIVNPGVTTITVSSDKGSLPADGISQAKITALVLDSGSPVTTGSVTFASTLGTLSLTSVNLDSDGRAVTYLTSIDIGQTTVTATFNSDSGTVNVTFTEVITDITPVPVTTYPISLSVGWNLISLPLIPDSTIIGDVLAGISSNVNLVKYYDTSTETWLSYVPNTGGTLSAMEDGKGYWIFMEEADTLVVNGVEMPGPAEVLPVYPVIAEWNLIGFKSVDYRKSSAYLSGVSYITVYGYDEDYSRVAHPASNIDNDMRPGFGYWLYADAAGNIVP